MTPLALRLLTALRDLGPIPPGRLMLEAGGPTANSRRVLYALRRDGMVDLVDGGLGITEPGRRALEERSADVCTRRNAG